MRQHEEFIKIMQTLMTEYKECASKVFNKDFVTHPGFDTTRILRKIRDVSDDHKRFVIQYRKGTERRRREEKDLFTHNNNK